MIRFTIIAVSCHALCGMLVLGGVGYLRAADAISDISSKLSPEQHAIVKSFLRSQDSIKRGECEITETRNYSKRKVDVTVHYAFDFDQDLVRCDTDFPKIGFRPTYRVVLTPEEMIFYTTRPSIAIKYNRSAPIPVSDVAPVDLRAFTLISIGEYQSRDGYPDILNFYKDMRPITVVKVSGESARWEITSLWERKDERPGMRTVFQRIWNSVKVDGDLGFSPTQSKWYSVNSFTPFANDLTPVGNVRQIATYDWTVHDGARVLKRILYSDLNVKSSIEVDLKWKSVNKPLDESLFTLDGLKLPPGTKIDDEQNVIEDIVPSK